MAVKAKDIANQMGISVSTVYKAFNGADDINAETRAAVLETAAEMGYTGGHGRRFPNGCAYLWGAWKPLM